MSEHLSLSDSWRKAAVDRWYDSQDHTGQADTDPEPYAMAAADAAVRVVLEKLLWLYRDEYFEDIPMSDFIEEMLRSVPDA